jgi:hypothetical protein
VLQEDAESASVHLRLCDDKYASAFKCGRMAEGTCGVQQEDFFFFNFDAQAAKREDWNIQTVGLFAESLGCFL